MNSGTLKAIKAILETDPSISGSQRAAILRSCEMPEIPPPATNSRPQFVTATVAAEILNTSKRTVWRLARLGKIRRVKLGYRSTRFRLEDISSITSVQGSVTACT